jgi:hypothetical protein
MDVKKDFLRLERFENYSFLQIDMPLIERHTCIETNPVALLTDAADAVDDYFFRFGKSLLNPITVCGMRQEIVSRLSDSLAHLVSVKDMKVKQVHDEDPTFKRFNRATKLFGDDKTKNKPAGLVLEVLGRLPDEEECLLFCVVYGRWHNPLGSVVFKVPQEEKK